jgi:hypothetical protein
MIIKNKFDASTAARELAMKARSLKTPPKETIEEILNKTIMNTKDDVNAIFGDNNPLPAKVDSNVANQSNTLSTMSVAGLPELSPELLKVYEQHQGVGTEDWNGDSLPKLQLITGRNVENIGELAGGLAPKLGSYLYTGDMTMMDTVKVVICKSSAGFYTKNNNWKKEGDKKANYNIIVGGFIVDKMAPFQMYISGSRASRWFEFQDLMRPLTKSKNSKFPLYAFTVSLGMYKQKNQEYNTTDYFYTFDFGKNEQGQIILETDMDMLDMYKKMHDKLEDIIGSFRERYESDKQGILFNTSHVVDAVEATII